MYRYKNYILIILLSFAAAAAFLLALTFSPVSAAAEGISTVTFAYKTRTVLDNDGLNYTYNVTYTDNVHSKDVKVYFNIEKGADAVEYAFYVNDLTLERLALTEDISQTVMYEVTATGEFTVGCRIYNADGAVLSTAGTSVKSDNNAPESYAAVNTMQSWLKAGGASSYSVNIDAALWGDDVSGGKALYYAFSYTGSDDYIVDRTLLSGTGAGFSISGNGTLTINYIDNAGNIATVYYQFDKFDGTAPASPQITVIPLSDTEYARGFTTGYSVSIAYGADTQSGTAAEQYYIINGTPVRYNGSFILNTVMNYTITARTADNVGNASIEAQAVILSSTFDVYAPNIKNVYLTVDMKEENPLSIRFIATDAHSGVDYAFLDGTGVRFTPQISDVYSMEIVPFNTTSLVIKVLDRAGNTAVSHLALSYFADTDKSAKLLEYNTLYRILDFSEYNADTAAAIDKAYNTLNTALMATNTQDSEFESLFAYIDKLVAGTASHSYVIETVPDVVSSVITYKISAADFVGYKKGDGVRLALNAAAAGDERYYIDIADFSEAFCAPFNLSAYYNDVAVSNLNIGIYIEMNMPPNYAGRSVVLIEGATGNIVPTEIYNNKLAFHMKNSGDYVLVIKGKRTLGEDSAPKTISIFGKNMTYGAFFGTVFGTAGGAAILVTVLAVLRKKKR